MQCTSESKKIIKPIITKEEIEEYQQQCRKAVGSASNTTKSRKANQPIVRRNLFSAETQSVPNKGLAKKFLPVITKEEIEEFTGNPKKDEKDNRNNKRNAVLPRARLTIAHGYNVKKIIDNKRKTIVKKEIRTQTKQATSISRKDSFPVPLSAGKQFPFKVPSQPTITCKNDDISPSTSQKSESDEDFRLQEILVNTPCSILSDLENSLNTLQTNFNEFTKSFNQNLLEVRKRLALIKDCNKENQPVRKSPRLAPRTTPQNLRVAAIQNSVKKHVDFELTSPQMQHLDKVKAMLRSAAVNTPKLSGRKLQVKEGDVAYAITNQYLLLQDTPHK